MARCHRVLLKHKQGLLYVTLLFMCYVLLSKHRQQTSTVLKLSEQIKRDQTDVDGSKRHLQDMVELYKNKKIRQFYVTNYDPPSTSEDGRIHIAMASCSGKRQESTHLKEAETFLKSAIFNNPSDLHFHIFTTDFNRFFLSTFLAKTRNTTHYDFRYTFYNKTFPENVLLTDTRSHKKTQQYVKIDDLFRPCSAQRLYMPWALKSLSKVIYIDTDCLVLGSLTEMWETFRNFNATQYFALAPIAYHVTDFTGLYHIKSPGRYGFNAGVALMDLDKIRQRDWRDEMLQLTFDLNEQIPGLTDQAVINEFFHRHREAFYEMSCSYNYRKDYCEARDTKISTKQNGGSALTQECADAQKHGALILHGVWDSFSSEEYFIKYVFEAYNAIQLGVNTRLHLRNLLKELLLYHFDTQCSNVAEIFYKRIES